VSASIALHAGVIGRALWLLSGVVLPTMSLAEGAGGDGLRRGDFAIYSRTSTQSLPLPALPAMLASDEMDETEYRPNVPLDTSERKFQKLSLRESNADADDAGWLGPFPQKQLAMPVFRSSARGAATGADHNARTLDQPSMTATADSVAMASPAMRRRRLGRTSRHVIRQRRSDSTMRGRRFWKSRCAPAGVSKPCEW
jgi:hypothetical protein